ncbi:VOC family protein [soil metagenome]
MKSIIPHLWFDNNLEEAVDLYSSIFPDAKTHSLMRLPDGNVMAADFEIAGQPVKGLNGGPQSRFNESFSFFVECDDQEEVDRYWEALIADGGKESQCGWLKDRFGLSWQIIPTRFMEMISTGSPEQVGRVMAAMMKMQKMDVGTFEEAYRG